MPATALLEQPHHDGAELHVPDDAPALGEDLTVFVRVPHQNGAERLWVRTTPDAEPGLAAGVLDQKTAAERWWRFEVHARNPVTTYRFLLDGGRHGYHWLNGTGTHAHDVTDAGDFRLSTAPPPPAWARDAIVYQVFPDRFARSAAAGERALPAWAVPAAWDEEVIPSAGQLYGGDLDGVADHLDH